MAPLGAGGMGEVYHARDTKLNRDVAVKVLPELFANDAQHLSRFTREAQTLAALNHPNIATIYGIEEFAGGRALVMEMVEGDDLSVLVAAGPMPPAEALPIAKQIAEALEAAHEQGIIHRDLKPANIKVRHDGTVKVLDFGLAKAMDPVGASSTDPMNSPTMTARATQEGLILGTAAYMAPEQARGKAVDMRADIWAFGAVLYEMLSGKRLFEGETVSDTLAAVLKTDPDWTRLPAGTPPSVQRLLRRCLDRDLKRRLQAIGVARFVLEEGAPDDTAPPIALSHRSPLRQILPWAITAIAVFAAGWLFLGRGPGGPGPLQALHFDIAFPPEIEPVPTLESGFALSPDGQVVAMIGVKNGLRTVFARRLQSGETIEIPESGATGCAFSPDSLSIALIAGGRLISFSLVDGQKKPLAPDADQSGGVAWGESGIVFARGGSLWIVPSKGGDARPLTTLDAARREVLHAGQIVLPGGRTVLFSSLTSEPGTERIESVPIDGGPRAVVIERASTPIWSPGGHLLFARDGAVLATDFDATTAKALGAATPIIPPGQLATSSSGALALRLSSNGTQLFVPHNFQWKRVVSVARDGSALALDMPQGPYTNPRVSPDGQRVIFCSGHSLLEAWNFDRRSLKPLTTAAPATSFPIWNYDGTRIFFRRYNTPAWTSADGSGKQGQVPSALANDYPSGPGPDPDTLFVTRIQPETSGDVYLMSASGAFEPRRLISTRTYEGGAQLSPDGRWLAYVSNESGQSEILVRQYPALGRQWDVSEAQATSPAGAPTDRRSTTAMAPTLWLFDLMGRGPSLLSAKPRRSSRTSTTSGRAPPSRTTTSRGTAVFSCCAATHRAAIFASFSTGPKN